jgi:hypothetical protein
MVLMPSLSDCDCDWAVLASCGVDMDRVTWLLGMGDRERSREGVIAPEPWTQGAEWAMKLVGEWTLAMAHAAPRSANVDVRVLGHGRWRCRQCAMSSQA